MKRTRIKPVSDKRREQNAVRRALIAALKAERGARCERCGRPEGDGWVCDGHELRKRSQGGSPLDAANVVLLCRNVYTAVGCHPLTESEPLLMAEEGWLIRAGDTPEAAARRRSWVAA